jgi:GTPase SAR1 family protein
METIKVIIIGDCDVGKTSLLSAFIYGDDYDTPISHNHKEVVKINDKEQKSEKEWSEVIVVALRPPHPEDGRDRSHPDYMTHWTKEELDEMRGIAEDDPNREEKLQKKT